MEENNKKSWEFDLVAILRKSLSEFRLLAIVCFVSAVLGTVVAFNRTRLFTAQVVLAPEMSAGGMGMSESLASMASSFGINLGSKASMDAIYPELYPAVLASNDFIIALFDVPVHLKETGADKTYLEHLKEDYRMPFWDYPKMWLRKLLPSNDPYAGRVEFDPFRLSRKQESLVEFVRNSVACLIDQKTSVITICMTDVDAEVAAIMADTVQHRLQDYITDYRTKKARQDVDYYTQLVKSSREEYETARDEYVAYSDTHQGASLGAFTTRLEELENLMQLRYNVYQQMVAQQQTALGKVQERTPAYTIIQSSSVPNKPSSLPRIYVMFIFVFLGGLLQLTWVNWGRDLWRNRHTWKTTK